MGNKSSSQQPVSLARSTNSAQGSPKQSPSLNDQRKPTPTSSPNLRNPVVLTSKEDRRKKAAIVIQKNVRAWIARKKYKEMRKTIILFVLVQSVIRGRRARKAYKALKYRTRVAQEILQTEKIYVSNLRNIVELFLNPLSATDIITKEEVKSIFGEVVVIYNFHKHFIESFEVIISRWSKYSKIGALFLEMGVFLKVYSNYVNNFDKSLETIKRLQSNPLFVQFMEKTYQRKEAHGNDLASFLICPIQRIPRYVLLITDLWKNTESTHPDYEELKSALATIKDTADIINQRKRDYGNNSEILRVHSQVFTDANVNLSGLIAPHRLFVSEGNFKNWKEKYAKADRGSSREVDRTLHLFLFSDVLLITKPIIPSKEPKYRLSIQLPLKNLNIFSLDDNQVIKNAFLLKATHKTWTCICENDKEKKNWVRLLEDHIQKDVDKAVSKTSVRGFKAGVGIQNSASDHAKNIIAEKYAKM